MFSVQCTVPTVTAGRYSDCTSNNLVNYGTECTLSCSTGDTPSSSTITCETNGLMSDQLPACETGGCVFFRAEAFKLYCLGTIL